MSHFSPVPTALIGVSGYGGVHFNALCDLQNEGQIKLTAATIINQKEEAAKCAILEARGCRIYDCYEEMLAHERRNLELCVIPTGIAWHCPMVVAALEVGCHVLVEKPAAATIAEVDEMIFSRDNAGRQVAVGFHHLYHEEYLALKKCVMDGVIGQVREIRVRASWPRASGYYARNDWAGRLRSNGRWVLDSPANNAFAHFLMAALHLAGPSSHVAASPLAIEAELYRTQEIETFDTMAARVSTDSGVGIVFAVTHCAHAKEDPIVDLIGDKGTICWEVDNRLTVNPSTGPSRELSLMSGRISRNRIFSRVLSQIRGLEPEICRLEEARKHTLLINALHKAIPINNIEPEHRDCYEAEAGSQHAIHGVSDLLQQISREGLLFSELGAPWAKGTHTVAVENSCAHLTNARAALGR